MYKTMIAILVGLLLVGGGVYYFAHPAVSPEEVGETDQTSASVSTGNISSLKNTAFTFGGATIKLTDGVSETSGSALVNGIRYFGNEAEGDLNGDGTPDAAFLVTQSLGENNTIYYVVAATKDDAGYHGTNAMLLGEGIAPQTTEIRDGELIVNYAVRPTGAPATEKPSIDRTSRFRLMNNILLPSVPGMPAIPAM